MPPRDYESAPVADQLELGDVIRGLVSDLKDMREKRISPQDGMARAAVAKQLFNGVRLYLQAMQMLEAKAKPADAGRAALSRSEGGREAEGGKG